MGDEQQAAVGAQGVGEDRVGDRRVQVLSRARRGSGAGSRRAQRGRARSGGAPRPTAARPRAASRARSSAESRAWATAAGQLGLARVAAGEQQVLAERGVEHVRVLRDEPDGRAGGVAVAARAARRRRASRSPRSRGTAAAPRRASTCPRRSGRRSRRGPARQVQVDSVEHVLVAVAGLAGRRIPKVRSSGSGRGWAGSRTGTGASSTARTRALARDAGSAPGSPRAARRRARASPAARARRRRPAPARAAPRSSRRRPRPTAPGR